MVGLGCRINRNDVQCTNVENPTEHPILVSFMSADAGDKRSRRKMLVMAKELKSRGYKVCYKSFGSAKVVRFCVVATNASAETAHDVASDHFTDVEVDLRPIGERIRRIDKLLFGDRPGPQVM